MRSGQNSCTRGFLFDFGRQGFETFMHTPKDHGWKACGASNRAETHFFAQFPWILHWLIQCRKHALHVQYQLRIVTWCSSALSNRSKNLPGFLNSMYPSTPRWAMLVSSLPIETTFRLIDCTRNSAFSINTPLSALNMIRLIAQYYLSHNLENLLKTQNTRSAAENASKDFILLRKWGTGKESARRYLTFPW